MKSKYLASSLLALGATLVASSAALAQNVEAKKEESGLSIPKINSTLMLRHYYRNIAMQSCDDPGADQTNCADRGYTTDLSAQLRAIFSTTILEKVDLSAMFRFYKFENTDRVQQIPTRLTADYNLVASDYATVQPKVLIIVPENGNTHDVTQILPGLFAKGALPVGIMGGKGEIFASAEADTIFTSRQTDQTVERETPKTIKELGLTGADDAPSGTNPNGNKSLTYLTEYDVGAHIPLGDVAIDLGETLAQSYIPRYVATGSDGVVETSYPVRTETYESLKVTYKISEKLSVADNALLFHDGVYEKSRVNFGEDPNNLSGEGRFTNIAYVSYSM